MNMCHHGSYMRTPADLLATLHLMTTMRVVDATMLLSALAKPTALMAAVRHESVPLRLLYTNKLFSL
jgi:hypothetical protein